MKKVIAWLLVLALTAAVSIGATLAYLTDTDEDVNVMTLGKVKIDQLEYERVDVESKDDDATVQEFHDNKPLLPAVTKEGLDYSKPGDTYVDWEQIGKKDYTSPIWDPSKINNEVDKMVFVKNKGDYDAYVRSVFAFEAGNYTTLEEFQKMVHLNLNETDWTWEWAETPVKIGGSTYFVATATYNYVLEPGTLTEISLSQIALDKTATNADVEAFGDTYQVLVKSQGIQADGFDDPDTALTEGFGEIITNEGTEDAPMLEVNTDNLPWEDDNSIEGIDLRTALHYLDGEKTGTKITQKVSKVVFALNEEYPEIIEKHKGTLVDVEQDVPVYAYYVPNVEQYDLYFLASDRIYAPKDSTELFWKMSAMKELDMHNFDVSRTVNMYQMLRECSSLETVDVSKWDTSNVVDMYCLFNRCRSLVSIIGTENWDTGKVERMTATFQDCNKLEHLNVGTWDTSSVTDMRWTFLHCTSLKTLDVANWDVSKVTSFRGMFNGNDHKGDMQLEKLDVSKWDTSSCEYMGHMFYGCGKLKQLDVSNFDTSKVTSFTHMFADCFMLESLDVSKWNTGCAVDMNGMFNSCKAIRELDVSSFDTQNVEDFGQLFDGCYALEEIVGLDQWDTSNGVYFYEFLTSTKVREIDLSTFNMSKAGYTRRMFYANSELTTIFVGDNWNFDIATLDTTSADASYSGMTNLFEQNSKLTGGNGSTPKTFGTSASTGAIYARVDTEEAPGLLTHINDKPVEEPTE